MLLHRSLGALAAAAALTLAAPALSATAQTTAATPYYSCTFDSFTHVTADWLRVHTSPGTSTPAIGQLPRGAGFSFCSSSGTTVGGLYWVYGTGYNGSVSLTGWVAGQYLVWP